MTDGAPCSLLVRVHFRNGSWRSETAWPPEDSYGIDATLNGGDYTDDGQNNGTGSGSGTGVWTSSPRLTEDAHFSGVPKVSVDVSSAPANANLVVDVYDIDSGRDATLVSRGAYLLSGNELANFDLYGDDWKIPAGHRVGVLITSANAEWWLHLPTLGTVTVRDARIQLPFLKCTRTSNEQGAPSVKLESYKAEAPFNVPGETIESAESANFVVPSTTSC